MEEPVVKLSTRIKLINKISREQLSEYEIYVRALDPRNTKDREFIEDFNKTRSNLVLKGDFYEPSKSWLKKSIESLRSKTEADDQDSTSSASEQFVDSSPITPVKMTDKAGTSTGNVANVASRATVPAEAINALFTKETIKMNELVVRPEVFDGQRPRPRHWWESYKDAILANGWSEVIAIKYFSTFLVGPARDWYITEIRPLILEGRLYRVADLGKQFQENYLGEADYRNLCRHLSTLRQMPTESVSTFIPKVRRLLLMMDADMSEKEQVRQIAEKLRPEYQMDLARFDSSSVSKLREVCLKVEAGLAAERVHRSLRNMSIHDGGDRLERRPITRRPYQSNSSMSSPFIRRRNRPQYSSERSQDFRPHASNRPINATNSRFNATRRPFNNSSQTSSRPSVNTNKNGITCYRCERKGHYAPDCRAKLKADGSTIIDRDKRNQVATITSNEANTDFVLTKKCLTVTQKSKRLVSTNLNVNAPTNRDNLALIQIELKCNHVPIKGTVDTGSQVTVMSLALAEFYGWTVDQPNYTLKGAGGVELKTVGSKLMTLEVTINKVTREKRHSVIIVDDLTVEFIVGLDLMAALQLSVDTAKRRVTFADSSAIQGIRAATDLTIQPRQQMIAKANVATVGTILALPYTFNPNILIANGISEVVNNQVEVLICNLSDKKTLIKTNTQLATYETIDEPNKTNLLVNSIERIGKSDEHVNIDDNLDDKQKNELVKLINEHQRAFSINGEIGLTNLAEHKIELLPDSKPHNEPLRRRALTDVEECRKQVKELLEKGFIEESNSPWSSAYVLVKKKNGTKRLCIDFRKLNDQTKKLVFPLPNIDECLDTLSGKKYFTTLDMASGFWQIPMEPESKELTAFKTEDGLFHFTRMPFGLTNAPASFQRMVNAMFAGLKGMSLQVFIDDICVATETWQEHLYMLRQVFNKVIEAGLTLKSDKCLFAATRIIFLGHEISSQGIRQDPAKLKALTKLKPPTDKDGVRRFLGMSGYYRKFVPNFAQLSEPLTRLIRKNTTFKWEGEETRAFKAIIDQLAQNATLTHYNHKDPLMLKTDASHKGVAGILLQHQQDEWKMVTCCSRRLTDSEANYGITDLEGLAVVYCCQKLRPYLLGKQFEIVCDHSALTVLKTRVPASARLRRWALILSEFDFVIRYTKGNLHEDVDCFSRAPVNDETDAYLDDKVYLVYAPTNVDDWLKHYVDEDVIPVLEDANNNLNNYSIKNKLIYWKDKLFVPLAKREKILNDAHESTGHGGMKVTEEKLAEFHWPNLHDDVKSFVEQCNSCQRRKIDRLGQSGRVYHHEAFEPLDVVAIDAWHTNKASRRNNKYVITAIDCFTKFIDAKALPNMTGAQATVFLHEFIGHFGAPRTVLTDNAQEFAGSMFKETLQAYNIKHRNSTPGHSQGNAVVERAIQTLQDRLSSAFLDQANSVDWDDLLPTIVLGINGSVHSTTRYSPYELMFGRRIPLRTSEVEPVRDPKDMYAKLIKQHLEQIHREARVNISTAHLATQARDENPRRNIEFEVGNKVLARNAGKRDDSKTGERYQGPFEVVTKDRDVYELRHLDSKKRYYRHVSSLKPYNQKVLFLQLLSLLTCMSLSATAQTFDEEPFVAYMGTDHFVEDQRVFVDLAIGIVGPCPRVNVIPFAPTPEGIYSNTDREPCGPAGCLKLATSTPDKPRLWHYISLTHEASEVGLYIGAQQYDNALMIELMKLRKECNIKWKEILNLLEIYETTKTVKLDYFSPGNNNRVVRRPKPKQGVPRKWTEQTNATDPVTRGKRGVGTEILKEVGIKALEGGVKAIGSAIGVTIVTDLVKSAWEYFYPNSNTNRLKRLGQMMEQNIHNTDLLKEIIGKLVSVTEDIGKREEYNLLTFKQYDHNSRIIQLMKQEVHQGLDNAIYGLQLLIGSKVKGLLDPYGLIKIASMPPNILTFDSRAMDLLEVSLKPQDQDNPTTLMISFNLHRISNSAHIVRVFSFPHWNLNGPMPRFLEMEGEPFAVYNESVHCIQQIKEPLTMMVTESCDDQDYIDERLTRWNVKFEVEDPRQNKTEPTQLHTNQYSLIYCFTYNITINEITSICPNAVIRIPVTWPYQIGGKKPWQPSEIQEHLILRTAHVLDSVHMYHFNESETGAARASVDYQLIEVKKLLRKYQNIDIQSIRLEKDFVWYFGLGTICVIMASFALCVCYCCWKNSVISKCCALFCSKDPQYPGPPGANETYRMERPNQQPLMIERRVRFDRTPSSLSIAAPASAFALES